MYIYIYIYIFIYIYIYWYQTAEGKTKNLLIVKLDYKIKNVFTNVELNILKSDVNWFLSMCNNYLQETAIKISIRFSFKTYDNLKMIDRKVYIKCRLLLKVINSVFYGLFS